jgi:hypothetical protein
MRVEVAIITHPSVGFVWEAHHIVLSVFLGTSFVCRNIVAITFQQPTPALAAKAAISIVGLCPPFHNFHFTPRNIHEATAFCPATLFGPGLYLLYLGGKQGLEPGGSAPWE